MTITCFIGYEVGRFQREAWQRYTLARSEIIPRWFAQPIPEAFMRDAVRVAA